VIALDIDGVCADTNESLRAYCCRELGLEPTRVPIPSDYYDMVSVWPLEHQERVDVLIRGAFALDEGGVYSEAPEVPYASRIAGILAGWGLVAGYVTRRPEGVLGATQSWLERNNFPRLQVRCAPRGTPKAEIVQELGAVGMIEDSPIEALQLAQAGLRVALMDWPYNRDVRHRRVERARSWSEAASRVLAWEELRCRK
jgi:hypothetical protein